MRPLLCFGLLHACTAPTDPDKAATADSAASADSDSARPDSGHTGETDAHSGETGETAETADTGETGAPGPDCALSTSDDTHIDEGELLDVGFLCGGALREDLELTLTGIPTGAAWDPNTWSLTWVPGLGDAGRFTVHLSASNGATLDQDLWVSDAFFLDDNEPVDPETYTLEDGLPVFHLDVAGSINNTYDTPATLVYRGHTYRIEAQYRGASSYYYPQKSFTLKFDEDDKFDDDDFGWGKAEDLILLTTFDDNSYLRNALTYWLWGELDPDNMTPRTFPAVLYLEGEFWGVYQVIERVDEEFYEHRGLSHYGDMYMGIDHNANFYATSVYGSAKSTLYDGYEKRIGHPEDGEDGAYDPVAALVEWAATSTDGEFRSELDDVLVADEIYDWFILVTFAGGWDSGGKNQLIYHDPESDGPWRFVPWDFNASWGQQWETSRVTAETWDDFTWTNNLFYRSLNDTLLAHALWSRYRAALEGPLRPEVLTAQIDAWHADLEPAAARSWRLWESQYHSYSGWASSRAAAGDFTTPDEEFLYLSAWVEARWSAADAEVAAAGF